MYELNNNIKYYTTTTATANNNKYKKNCPVLGYCERWNVCSVVPNYMDRKCYFDRKCSSNPLLRHLPQWTQPALQLQGSIHSTVQSPRQITRTHSHECTHITITTWCRASSSTILESRHLSKVQRHKYYHPISRTTRNTHSEPQYHQGATFNALLDTNYFGDEPFQAINCTGTDNQTHSIQERRHWKTQKSWKNVLTHNSSLERTAYTSMLVICTTVV